MNLSSKEPELGTPTMTVGVKLLTSQIAWFEGGWPVEQIQKVVDALNGIKTRVVWHLIRHGELLYEAGFLNQMLLASSIADLVDMIEHKAWETPAREEG